MKLLEIKRFLSLNCFNYFFSFSLSSNFFCIVFLPIWVTFLFSVFVKIIFKKIKYELKPEMKQLAPKIKVWKGFVNKYELGKVVK